MYLVKLWFLEVVWLWLVEVGVVHKVVCNVFSDPHDCVFDHCDGVFYHRGAFCDFFHDVFLDDP